MIAMDRLRRTLVFILPLVLAGCVPDEPDEIEEVPADELCAQIVQIVCSADARCCDSRSPRCVEEQTEECADSIQPLVDDARLAYDPVAGLALVESIRARAEGCWQEPLDYAALVGAFAGTGVQGADCTPPNLQDSSLRESALSCTRGLACRLHLRAADSSTEAECEPRTDDACSHPHDCEPGTFCSLADAWRPGMWGTCRPLRTNGWACRNDLECASGHCDVTCGAPRQSALCLTTSYEGIVKESSPLAFLRFDEEDGILATDSSGNVNGGTLSATVLHDPSGAIGRIPAEPPPDAGPQLDGGVPLDLDEGGSLRFASDDAVVRVAAIAALASADELTFEAWIKPDSAETRGPILELNDLTTPGVRLWSHDRGDRLYVAFPGQDGEAPTLMSAEAAVSPGAWHHVAATFDGETGRLYLDGRMIGETAATAPLVLTGDLFIGHRPTGEMPLSYRGAIDEVAVYDRALEGRELTRHHRAGPSGITTSRFALFRWLDP